MRIEGKIIEEVVLKEKIGIEEISTQILKKALQRGIEFNLFVAGEKGIGAKTLISSIYNLESFPQKVQSHSPELKEYTALLQTNDISLKLNIFLYQGKDAEFVKDFLVGRNIVYNKNNIGLRRERKEDPRIHASLFLISPFEFKQQDIEIIKVLSEYSNTFPIIPKRDIFTALELNTYKEKIAGHLSTNKISVSSLIPPHIGILSVIASTNTVKIEGFPPVRGREYAWGVINAEDPALSDLLFLTQLLLSANLIDLKRKTVEFYQKWKETIGAELPILEGQDTVLLKEIEYTIANNFKEKLLALEKEEQMIDHAVKSLAEPAGR